MRSVGMPVFSPGHLLGPVEQFPGHHAAIDDDDRQPRRAVVEDEAPGEQRVVDLGRAVLEEAAVDQDREGPGRHIDRGSPGAECQDRRQVRAHRPQSPVRE